MRTVEWHGNSDRQMEMAMDGRRNTSSIVLAMRLTYTNWICLFDLTINSKQLHVRVRLIVGPKKFKEAHCLGLKIRPAFRTAQFDIVFRAINTEMLLHVCKHASTHWRRVINFYSLAPQTSEAEGFQSRLLRCTDAGPKKYAMFCAEPLFSKVHRSKCLWPYRLMRILCAKSRKMKMHFPDPNPFVLRHLASFATFCCGCTKILHCLSPSWLCVNKARQGLCLPGESGMAWLWDGDFGLWPGVDFAAFRPGSTAARPNENFK